jgi:hypothetical protein
MEPHDLASIIRKLANNPSALSRLQAGAYVEEHFGLDAIGRQLEELTR